MRFLRREKQIKPPGSPRVRKQVEEEKDMRADTLRNIIIAMPKVHLTGGKHQRTVYGK